MNLFSRIKKALGIKSQPRVHKKSNEFKNFRRTSLRSLLTRQNRKAYTQQTKKSDYKSKYSKQQWEKQNRLNKINKESHDFNRKVGNIFRRKSLFNVIQDKMKDVSDESDRRKSKLQQEKLNLASDFDTLGKNSEFKAKLFYMATQRLWEGHPAKDRNQIIIKKLGVDNLEQAYKLVMNTKEIKDVLKIFNKEAKKLTSKDDRYKLLQELFDEEYEKVILVGLQKQ